MNISYEYLPIETVKRIKQLAKAKGVKMQDLADNTGLSTNTIAKSAKGTEGMKAKNLFLIAEILECSVDYLLGRTDSPETTTNSQSENFTPSDTLKSDFIKIFDDLSTEDKIKVLYQAVELKNRDKK